MQIPQACIFAAVLSVPTAVAGAAEPDVLVGDVFDVMRWGTMGTQEAFSAAPTLCNVGNLPVPTVGLASQHPLVAFNLYRAKDGRFEQIGQSWAHHEYSYGAREGLCGHCQVFDQSILGPGCSMPVQAHPAGQQPELGPRSQVNPYTGEFSFPIVGVPPPVGQMRRLLVDMDDLRVALNPGARYFVEAIAIAPGELGDQRFNNASFREVRVGESRADVHSMFIDRRILTRRMMTGLSAWAEVDPSVSLTELRIPGDGAIWVAWRVSTTPDGFYRYDYAVENVNADRGVGSFGVPVSRCTAIASADWRGVPYHSGEPWSNAVWIAERLDDAFVWRSPSTYADDPETNALRWGTTYNYRLVTRRPPTTGLVALGLFKPGAPNVVNVEMAVPSLAADFNCDGFVDFFDYGDFVNAFETGLGDADFNGDGFVDFFDYGDFVAAFEAGC